MTDVNIKPSEISELPDDLINKKRKHEELDEPGLVSNSRDLSGVHDVLGITPASETRSLNSASVNSTSTNTRSVVSPIQRMKIQHAPANQLSSFTSPQSASYSINPSQSFQQPTPSPISANLTGNSSLSSNSSANSPHNQSLSINTPLLTTNYTVTHPQQQQQQQQAVESSEDGDSGSRLLRHINKKPYRVWTYKVQRLQVPGTQLSSLDNGAPNDIISVPIRVMGSIDELYFVAADLSQLIHSRKSNIAKAVSAFTEAEKARMPILCPRSNGTVSTHVLTVLSLSGVKRLLQASRAAIALPILKWILDKIQELKMNPRADEDSTNLNQQANLDKAKVYANTKQRPKHAIPARSNYNNSVNALLPHPSSAPQSTTSLNNSSAIQALLANNNLNNFNNVLGLNSNSQSTAASSNNNFNWLNLLNPSLNNSNPLLSSNFNTLGGLNSTNNNPDTSSAQSLLQQLQQLQTLQNFNNQQANPMDLALKLQLNNINNGMNSTSPLASFSTIQSQLNNLKAGLNNNQNNNSVPSSSSPLSSFGLPLNLNSNHHNPISNINNSSNPTPLQVLQYQRLSQTLINSATNP
jgi:prophage antirepressor-like protein